MRRLLFIISLSALWFQSAALYAHQLSTAYGRFNLNAQGLLQGEWQLRLYDLEQAIGIDVNGDGKLRWQELQDRADIINHYLNSQLHISRGDKDCAVLLDEKWKIDTHFNEGYLVVPVRAQCALAGVIHFQYSAFFNQDTEHKWLLSLTSAGTTTNRILGNTQRNISWDAAEGDAWTTFIEFVWQGMVHIWIGLDHILFLVLLLLTCVLVRRNNQWLAEPSTRRILISTTWIVTAFTLAHSITLTATALDFIHLPSRWVEAGIAISVLLVALNNLYTVVIRLGWLTFGFGLLHGMGFAGVLGELGLPADQTLLTVLAFNLGVEFGQMVIVIFVLPLLMVMRHYFWYVRYTLMSVSTVIGLVAVQWIIERLF